MTDDRRAVLEAIAYGSDSSIRPAERLRALELLDELDRREPPWASEPKVDGQALQRELDAATATLLMIADDDELLREWPETARVLTQRVEQRVRHIAESAPEAEVIALHAAPEQATS